MNWHQVHHRNKPKCTICRKGMKKKPKKEEVKT